MKYRTACNLTEMVKTAILVFGANGIIEDFSIVPRLLRDSLIVETWEGPHNTLCLQIMRDAHRFNFWQMLQKEISGYLDAWPKNQATLARALYEQSFKSLMNQMSEINSPQAIAIHAKRVVDHAACLIEAGCYVGLLQKQGNQEEGFKLVTHYLEKSLNAQCGNYELSLAKWGTEEILKVLG
ncbi:MAG: acyl-CoA dehydrogenase [uncultured bacterium]|nr:MAG: acyl-CoA dehydrogenase [uncultured bacterium]